MHSCAVYDVDFLRENASILQFIIRPSSPVKQRKKHQNRSISLGVKPDAPSNAATYRNESHGNDMWDHVACAT